MNWEEACRILGVKDTASSKEIDERYRNMVLLLHPDANVGKPEWVRLRAEEELKLVSQAYRFLKEPTNNPSNTLDCTPLTLGVESTGGFSIPVIARDTAIPASRSFIVSTVFDGQTSIELHVVQGEQPIAAYNHTVCRVVIDGIKPDPGGFPEIEVNFHIDANGILVIKAHDKDTGREQKITVAYVSAGLSKEEVRIMQKGRGTIPRAI